MKFNVAPGAWKFLATGTLPTASPKPLTPLPSLARPLEKKQWTATASVPDSTTPVNGTKIPIDISAANALDGDHWTGWRDMTELQRPGQWFQVDMKRDERFAKVVLDNTWALWDSPETYAIAVSKDGTTWSEPIATGQGKLGITTITFPEQTARYLRIMQTGTSAKYHWSIYELDVFAER